MGVRDVLGVNPVELVNSLISSANVKGMDRRRSSQHRVDLYYDNGGNVLREKMAPLFQYLADRRRVRVEAFATFSSALSIFRRVVNEIATPVYNPPPLRVVMQADGATVDEAGNAAYFEVCKAARLNQRMDLAVRLMQATNDVILHPKWSTTLGRLVVDIITPATCEVIPHPDDPSVMLGIAYLKEGGTWAYWDDREAFEVNKAGAVSFVLPASQHPGFLPFVEVHARERLSAFWDGDTGNDLVNAQMTVGLLLAQALRLHHTQGHTALAVNGSPKEFPRDQLLDPEAPIFAGENNSLSVLHNPADPGAHLRTADVIAMTAAANYGLSRERMNANATQATDHAAMYERRYETVQVMAEAEGRLFDMIRKVLGAALPVAADARLAVDFMDVSSKGDRETQLKVREQERHMGVRSVLDDVLEDNPELGSDREAARKFADGKLEEEAWYVERRRSLNISGDAGPSNPGQTPEQNGAMGPKVRDGQMSRDEAGKKAVEGSTA
jgi:hypothetical protein